MQRIVYLHEECGYCVAALKSRQEIPLFIAKLAANEAQVICVFDLETREASFICKPFDMHLKLLEASYPSSFLSKLFNRISPKKRPDYSVMSKLIRPAVDSFEPAGTTAKTA